METDLVAVGAVLENADKGDVVILQEWVRTVSDSSAGTPRSPSACSFATCTGVAAARGEETTNKGAASHARDSVSDR